PMMLFAYFYGIVGIVSGLMLLFAHFVTITSYGSPYGLPIAPFRLQELKDSFVRFPNHLITDRSSTGQPKQTRKQKGN
ncbi:spore germination protein, partial [Bacillus thuringiensis]|nr:spore germination protein [Bacillus thuringiensis]